MSAPLDAPISAGLDKVAALKPGSGFAELLAGARSSPTGSAFAFGEAAVTPGVTPTWQAGVGARVTW